MVHSFTDQDNVTEDLTPISFTSNLAQHIGFGVFNAKINRIRGQIRKIETTGAITEFLKDNSNYVLLNTAVQATA